LSKQTESTTHHAKTVTDRCNTPIYGTHYNQDLKWHSQWMQTYRNRTCKTAIAVVSTINTSLPYIQIIYWHISNYATIKILHAGGSDLILSR